MLEQDDENKWYKYAFSTSIIRDKGMNTLSKNLSTYA